MSKSYRGWVGDFSMNSMPRCDKSQPHRTAGILLMACGVVFLCHDFHLEFIIASRMMN